MKLLGELTIVMSGFQFEMLWTHTLSRGQRCLDSQHLTGSLEIGKKADFVIIDQDLLQLEATR